MMWIGKSHAYQDTVEALMAEVPDLEARERIYRRLLPHFIDHIGYGYIYALGKDPVYDRIIRELVPDEFANIDPMDEHNPEILDDE